MASRAGSSARRRTRPASMPRQRPSAANGDGRGITPQRPRRVRADRASAASSRSRSASEPNGSGRGRRSATRGAKSSRALGANRDVDDQRRRARVRAGRSPARSTAICRDDARAGARARTPRRRLPGTVTGSRASRSACAASPSASGARVSVDAARARTSNAVDPEHGRSGARGAASIGSTVDRDAAPTGRARRAVRLGAHVDARPSTREGDARCASSCTTGCRARAARGAARAGRLDVVEREPLRDVGERRTAACRADAVQLGEPARLRGLVDVPGDGGLPRDVALDPGVGARCCARADAARRGHRRRTGAVRGVALSTRTAPTRGAAPHALAQLDAERERRRVPVLSVSGREQRRHDAGCGVAGAAGAADCSRAASRPCACSRLHGHVHDVETIGARPARVEPDAAPVGGRRCRDDGRDDGRPDPT